MHDQDDSARPPLRRIALPQGLGLFFSAMPGRDTPLPVVTAAIVAAGIARILCLVGPDEIARKSPAYAAALASGTLPCPVAAFPITDFGIPGDAPAFAAWARAEAGLIAAGAPAMLHCAAGIGRTGTVGLCLLHLLGIGAIQAEALVSAAGAGPETPGQRGFVARFRAEETA